MARDKRKSKKSSVKKWLTFIILLLIAIFVLVCYFNPQLYDKVLELIYGPEIHEPDDEASIKVNELVDVKVHFIDVGQGDCILITLPDFKNVLIDAGDRDKEYNEHIIDYIKENAHKNSLTNKVTIDHFILTHPDADHIGGADEVFEEFDVKKAYRPYVYYSGDAKFASSFNKGYKKQDTASYKELLNAIKDEKYANNKKCEWEFFNYNSDFRGGAIYNDAEYSYKFDFLTPVCELEDIRYTDMNDYSPLIKFSYQDVSVLLTGDAEKEAENDFVNKYYTQKAYLDVDVLKVSHHGSKTSTTEAFLDLINPEYAVISCGEGNSYKHPHAQTLNRLFNDGCSLYRTDKNGDIVLSINNLGKFEFAVDKVGSDMFVAP